MKSFILFALMYTVVIPSSSSTLVSGICMAPCCDDFALATSAGGDQDPAEMPKLLKQTAAKYPEAGRKIGAGAYVLLKLVIDREGNVNDATPEKIEMTIEDTLIKPDNPRYDAALAKGFVESSINAAKEWKFSPAASDKPATRWVMVPFKFKLAKGVETKKESEKKEEKK
jgi:hypothetical protein